MPLYEYRCAACAHEFEKLVRTGDTPACPACGSPSLDRLLSQVAVSSEQTRQANLSKARQAAKSGVLRDKAVAQYEYEKKHREEGH
jgi:putative FmdB family regulatory protein